MQNYFDHIDDMLQNREKRIRLHLQVKQCIQPLGVDHTVN